MVMHRYLVFLLLFFLPAKDLMGCSCTDSLAGDPRGIVDNVSVIHGDYIAVETDAEVSAPDPIALRRSYRSSTRASTTNFGGWNFNPHCFLNKVSSTVYVAEDDGTTFRYVINQDGDYSLDSSGLVNTSRGTIDIWTNIFENHLSYEKKTDCFTWHLVSQGKRFYSRSQTRKDLYVLLHEILPSGNQIFYEYDQKDRIKVIRETNSFGTTELAQIRITYGQTVKVTTSDLQRIEYLFEKDTNLLSKVRSSHRPSVQYVYTTIENHPVLRKKILPEGRFVAIDYYQEGINQYKVQRLTSPQGANCKLLGISPCLQKLCADYIFKEFFYYEGYTEVRSPNFRKTLYHYDPKHRLCEIVEFLEEKPYRFRKNAWGEDKSDQGKLFAFSIENAQAQVLYSESYRYDDCGKILEKANSSTAIPEDFFLFTLKEIPCHKEIKRYAYQSTDDHFVVWEIDAQLSIKKLYKKGTNLLKKQYVFYQEPRLNDPGDLAEKSVYYYDENTTLVRQVTDDGTKQLITCISPKPELPNIGHPEMIEHRYFSKTFSQEKMIDKMINTFDRCGNIAIQSYYDQNEDLCYTTSKKYSHHLLIYENDSLGREIRYGYDRNRNLIYQSDGHTAFSFGYDLSNRLVTTTYKDCHNKTFKYEVAYDAAGDQVAEVDPLGNETRFENDALGRAVKITLPCCDRPFCVHYDLFDRAISFQDPEGGCFQALYTAIGKPLVIRHVNGTKERFFYDAKGNLKRYVDQRNLHRLLKYDTHNRLVEIDYISPKQKFLKKRSYKYAGNRLINETDEKGTKSLYFYDELGRVVLAKKDKKQLEFSYDPLGRLQQVKQWQTDKAFTKNKFFYDRYHRLTAEEVINEKDNSLFLKQYSYDPGGNLSKVITGESSTEIYDFDGLGRLLKYVNPSRRATHIAYDDHYIQGLGQRFQRRLITESAGNRTEEIFNLNGKMLRKIRRNRVDQVLSKEEFSYDNRSCERSKKAEIISSSWFPKIFKYQKEYNASHQLLSERFGSSRHTEQKRQFTYNIHGDLVKKTWSPSTELCLSYDHFGNLCKMQGSKEQSAIQHLFTYDLRNNLLREEITPNTTCIDYEYNRNDKMLLEKISDKYGSYELRRSYNFDGKIAALHLPDGSKIHYSYEGPYVKSIKRFDKRGQKSYSHQILRRDLTGNILLECLPGNLSLRRHFRDEGGKLIRIDTTHGFYDKVGNDGYDLRDNLRKRIMKIGNEKRIFQYEYDDLNHLVKEQSNAYTREYRYDSLGNRLSKNREIYQINGLNQLTYAHGSYYTYDVQGNLTKRADHQSTCHFSYDPIGHLITYYSANGNRCDFVYDGSGRKLSGGNKRFFYLDEREIGCMNTNNEMINVRIPLDPNDVNSPAIAIESNNQVAIPYYDLTGNIVCLMDSLTCQMIEHYDLSAFGEETIYDQNGVMQESSPFGNPWRYQGKHTDDSTKLVDYNNCLYEPITGRFIQPKIFEDPENMNFYRFNNNPLSAENNCFLRPANVDDRAGLLFKTPLP